MAERKYVKFRVDMYHDTKFKIIDTYPERDLIHYIWSRLVVLAGKVNLAGDLFLSKNIPYTTETLALEFNRDFAQVKSALNLLIELEMVELTENNIYKVKNFVKHQNIKVDNKNQQPEIVKEIEMDKSQQEIASTGELDAITDESISQQSTPIVLEHKKTNQVKRKNKKENSINITELSIDDEINDSDDIASWHSGEEKPLEQGEKSVAKWSFG